jgi:hypothetical protein
MKYARHSNLSLGPSTEPSRAARSNTAVLDMPPTGKKPIVILAPHASHPPMDGASYRSWSIAREFGRAGPDCYYFAKANFFKVLPDGRTEKLESIQNNRGKNLSALRTVVLGSHYLVEKHLPDAWTRQTHRWLAQIKPGLLFISFLWTWNKRWIGPSGIPIYIDTHNYDPEWWGNLKRSSGNWVSRRVCDLSCAYALKMLEELPAGTKLVHVTTGDRKRYLSHRPDLQHLILANGCDIQFRQSVPDYTSARKRLYFLGALNLRISQDALQFLAERFWPALREVAEMHVFGSGEAPEMEALCTTNGWTLHRNLPEDALAKELERMHYLVLPFSYSAGSKLKLVNACGKGIPIIATGHGVSGFEALPPTVFISEEPADWTAQITRPVAPSDAELSECRKFAEIFSWHRLVGDTGILEDQNYE